MNFDERVAAISDLGFTERQARFLVTVMLYAGVCVPRQYATFAGTAYGHTVSRFFDKLVRQGYATACGCVHNRAEVYHLRHRMLYRAIDEPHSRYRRTVPPRQVIDRLLRLDAVVLQPDLIWLVTEEEKVAFVSLTAPSFTERLPHGMVGQGAGRRLQLFPDDQPMGVTTTGRVAFTYLVTAYDTRTLRGFVQRHLDLLRALPGWTLRLVLPPQLSADRTRFEGAVREELTPIHPVLLRELKWYFTKRRSTQNPRALSFEDPDFWERQAAFRAPRYQELYRRWLMDGDTVFETVASSANTEALERGTGRIESLVLPLSYRHLTPLVSLFRTCRKGVEGSEVSLAPSQPSQSTSRSRSAESTRC